MEGPPDGEDCWDAISDSEFLSIQLEDLETDSHGQSSKQANANEDENPPAPTAGDDSRSRAEESEAGMERRRGAKRTSEAGRPCRSPMQRFRRRWLNVSLLSKQVWCEMKVEHGLLQPSTCRREMQSPRVEAGARIHLARELEVHSVVPVDIVTREDSEAIKLLNLLQMISELASGQCVREFPVFGVLEGVYVVGVVDELNFDSQGRLVLSELKTRQHDSPPGAAQVSTHDFQVGLYKLLFDGMVRGELRKEQVLEHMGLRAGQRLGAAVLDHARSVGVQLGSLGELLDAVLMVLTCSDLPCVDLLRLEYCHQASGLPIHWREPPFDPAQLRAKLQNLVAYWTGQRRPRGVDIEEAWKCALCPYQDTCGWRRDRAADPPAPCRGSKRAK